MTNGTLVRRLPRVRRVGDDLDLEWLRSGVAGPMRLRVGGEDVLVRVLGGSDAVLEVRAPVLVDVVHTSALAQRLSELSASLPAATLSWTGGAVMVATDLPLEILDHDELLEACITIRNVAAHFRARLHAEFGGQVAAA